MNEVESGTSRMAKRTGKAAVAAWDWYADLGQGAWLLTLGVLAVGALVLALVIGHGGTNGCDLAARPVSVVELYDGNRSLPGNGADQLYLVARNFDHLAAETTGPERTAVTDFAHVARTAKQGKLFDAEAALSEYQNACF